MHAATPFATGSQGLQLLPHLRAVVQFSDCVRLLEKAPAVELRTCHNQLFKHLAR